MIEKTYLEGELKKHEESVGDLQKQEVQLRNAIQQTVGAIHTLRSMIDKLSEGEGKVKDKK